MKAIPNGRVGHFFPLGSAPLHESSSTPMPRRTGSKSGPKSKAKSETPSSKDSSVKKPLKAMSTFESKKAIVAKNLPKVGKKVAGTLASLLLGSLSVLGNLFIAGNIVLAEGVTLADAFRDWLDKGQMKVGKNFNEPKKIATAVLTFSKQKDKGQLQKGFFESRQVHRVMGTFLQSTFFCRVGIEYEEQEILEGDLIEELEQVVVSAWCPFCSNVTSTTNSTHSVSTHEDLMKENEPKSVPKTVSMFGVIFGAECVLKIDPKATFYLNGSVRNNTACVSVLENVYPNIPIWAFAEELYTALFVSPDYVKVNIGPVEKILSMFDILRFKENEQTLLEYYMTIGEEHANHLVHLALVELILSHPTFTLTVLHYYNGACESILPYESLDWSQDVSYESIKDQLATKQVVDRVESAIKKVQSAKVKVAKEAEEAGEKDGGEPSQKKVKDK